MIPKAYITEWSQTSPWLSNYQVEQDLIIERALVQIFSHKELNEQLAFRGGTALHKLYLKPQARYSEDIDLVQVEAGNIGQTLTMIREQLSFLGQAKYESSEHNNTLFYKFNSEFEGIGLKLKIEINTREHFSILGYENVNHNLKSDYFSGKSSIRTFSIEELLGTKLRAMYQRNKGRDLFDLWYANERKELDVSKITKTFHSYLENDGLKVSAKEYILNMEKKIIDKNFTGDTDGLIRAGVNYNPTHAWYIIKHNIISKI